MEKSAVNLGRCVEVYTHSYGKKFQAKFRGKVSLRSDELVDLCSNQTKGALPPYFPKGPSIGQERIKNRVGYFICSGDVSNR
jgi:hypothetical protein